MIRYCGRRQKATGFSSLVLFLLMAVTLSAAGLHGEMPDGAERNGAGPDGAPHQSAEGDTAAGERTPEKTAAQPSPKADQLSGGDSAVFWSLRVLSRPEVPRVEQEFAAELGSPIDRFVADGLAARGLELSPEADRRTLCRRLFLDLIGLPPTPGELETFLNDTAPDATEQLVDRLLASAHYGERWGRIWLDVVGYADSNGYIRHDSLRPLAWHFRDYVISSLNHDKPYDRLWLEQLAGDELVNYQGAERLSADQLQTLIATHYLRNTPDGTDNTEGNETTRVIERYAVLESQLQTTMSAMFGMTIECARCHDHKFDPIPQRDYYALQSIFYPAFNVRNWVQPKDRWIYAAGSAEVADWKSSHEQADRDEARLQSEFREWLTAHPLPGETLWLDDFSAVLIADRWSATAPDDNVPAGQPQTQVDGNVAPAARQEQGSLSLLAGAAGDSHWLAARQKFDWTPNGIGHWIQARFDLIDSSGPQGKPAERIGYYISLHDANNDSQTQGGDLLLDGNPKGGAAVTLNDPSGSPKVLGTIGVSGFVAGRNYGVRITRVSEMECLLQQIVDGVAEAGSVLLTTDQLPDGAFGFELCCSRSFRVDNVTVEASQSAEDGAVAGPTAELAREITARAAHLEAALTAVRAKRLPEPDRIAWATDLSDQPPEVRMLERGDYFRPGEVVPAGTLSSLVDDSNPLQVEPPVSGAKTTGRRLAFARWATQPESRAAALLARVQADRIWRGHFGRGLVPTPENFGASGLPPTHPELLEWLAAQLVASGWRQKALHREIVLSRTYRQTSRCSDAAFSADPENRGYSRFPARRLDAEQIRDSLLMASGALNRRSGGPPVDVVDPGTRQIQLPTPSGPGPHEVDRRSIYIRCRRSEPLAFLRVFDQASPDPNCVARANSTVVGQSLAMLNGEFSVRMGNVFASRLFVERPESDESRIRQAFLIAVSREPTDAEVNRCQDFIRTQSERYRLVAGEVSAEVRATSDLCRMLLASSEFLFLQ